MWVNKFLDENTIYWSPPTKSGLGEGYIYPIPVDLLGRWQYSMRRIGGAYNIYSEMGTSLVKKATLWTNQALEAGGYVMIGLVADLPPGFVPDDTTSGALRVDTVETVRSLNFNNYSYKAYLDGS